MTDYYSLLQAETFEDYLQLVNVEVHQNISKCQQIAKEYQKMRIASEKEKHQAQMKLHETAQPYYQRRKEIVNGATPTNEEIEGYEQNKECPPNENSQYKTGVPCFWLHVLKNSKFFDEFQGSDNDAKILVYLNDISVEYFPAEDCTIKDGSPSLLYRYNIHFDFNENPALRNQRITLELMYKLGDVEGEFEEPVIKRTTPIDWVNGKDPRYRTVKKRNNPKGKSEKVESFFDLFYPTELALNNDINDDGNGEDEVYNLHEQVNILLTLINEVIPAAVNYFDETLIEDDEDDLDEDEDRYIPKASEQDEVGKSAADDGQGAQKGCETQ